MVVVSDTSSISNLLQIGLIDILRELFGEITITPAVKRELSRLTNQAEVIEKLDWIRVVTPQNQKLIVELLKELDLGESESIALAVEKQAKFLIIDEYRGRSVAESYGVKIVGVLGILINAKKVGLIKSVKEHIEKLRKIGFRLNQSLVNEVLKKINE